MNTRTQLVIAGLLVAIVLIAAACAPAAPPVPPVQVVATQPAAAPAPTAAPPPTKAPEAKPSGPATPQAASQAGVPDVQTAPFREGRMIVKNGDMNLLVADTDVAIDRATGIAVDLGGYLISSKSWMQDGFKYATLTMGVPVDQFEDALRRMRGLAVQVLDENASGQDVSTEFVDLQSRLTNLEATADRIREFLKQAKDVDESLQVNAKLAEITAEIEQVKGRMTYLKDRAAYSTLTVNLQPQRPTPTPSLTPTATPIPTVTPTPTANVWRPDRTFKEASQTLSDMLRTAGDILIWVVVVGIPCLLPLIGLWLIWRWLRPKKAKPVPPQPQQPRPPQQPLQPPSPPSQETTG